MLKIDFTDEMVREQSFLNDANFSFHIGLIKNYFFRLQEHEALFNTDQLTLLNNPGIS